MTSMHLLTTPLLVLIAIFSMQMHHCVGADDHEKELELASLADAFSANWEGLSSYDVQMTVEWFELEPSGKSEQQLLRYRLIADHAAERFFFVLSGTIEKSDLTDASPTVQPAVSAYCFDPETGVAYNRDVPRAVEKLPRKPLLNVLGESSFPDVRLIGLLDAPSTFNSRLTLADAFRTKFHLGKRIWERNRGSDFVEVCVDSPGRDAPGLVIRSIYEFDLERLVPRKYSVFFLYKEKTRRIRSETFEWEQKNGVYVPTAVHGVYDRLYHDVGQTTPYVRSYDLVLHWRSINEGIDKELDVTPQALLDTENLLRMVAPVDKK